jgi:hypothetical protein
MCPGSAGAGLHFSWEYMCGRDMLCVGGMGESEVELIIIAEFM